MIVDISMGLAPSGMYNLNSPLVYYFPISIEYIEFHTITRKYIE
jgi:hypothetical protein